MKTPVVSAPIFRHSLPVRRQHHQHGGGEYQQAVMAEQVAALLKAICRDVPSMATLNLVYFPC